MRQKFLWGAFAVTVVVLAIVSLRQIFPREIVQRERPSRHALLFPESSKPKSFRMNGIDFDVRGPGTVLVEGYSLSFEGIDNEYRYLLTHHLVQAKKLLPADVGIVATYAETQACVEIFGREEKPDEQVTKAIRPILQIIFPTQYENDWTQNPYDKKVWRLTGYNKK